MKHDHSFTLTAAVVLAGVILALVGPADAPNSNGAEAGVTGSSFTLPTSANTETVIAADTPST